MGFEENIVQLKSATVVYRGHTDWVYSVAWSPDGKRLASASLDQTARVWLWLQN
jgi:WD40 repeat protein